VGADVGIARKESTSIGLMIPTLKRRLGALRATRPKGRFRAMRGVACRVAGARFSEKRRLGALGATRPKGRLSATCIIVCCLAGSKSYEALAQTGPSGWLDFGGYVRSLTAVQDLGYDTPLVDRQSAFHGEVVRLAWVARFGEHWRFTVHNRLQAQVTSTAQGLGTGVVGFGVSAIPGRTVSLATTLLEGDQFRVTHDIDRLALDVYTGAVDFTVGRQAISWGISNLFPVADLWTQFSPFELDTEEKRGIDAIRALAYPGRGVELDMVVADRGTLRDLSGGARVTVPLPWADVYLAGGKLWRQLIAFGGMSIVFDTWKLRAEVGIPWQIDSTEFRPIRATVGIDRLGADYQLSLEYHHNGLGSDLAGEYLTRLGSPAFQRGETYFLGRHYLGLLGNYAATDRLNLAVSILTNLSDPSAVVSPVATYDLGQQVRMSFGGLVSIGESPILTLAQQELRSEFGTYGRLAYSRISVYF
jgi:hypothetical protein